jgi:hypothetical protein
MFFALFYCVEDARANSLLDEGIGISQRKDDLKREFQLFLLFFDPIAGCLVPS